MKTHHSPGCYFTRTSNCVTYSVRSSSEKPTAKSIRPTFLRFEQRFFHRKCHIELQHFPIFETITSRDPPPEFNDTPDSSLTTVSSDVLRRTKQKIHVTHDIFSSFMTGVFIPDERANFLCSAVLVSTNFLRTSKTMIHVDSATGFYSLKSNKVLSSHAISLDFVRVKNKNSNATIDKGIQELEAEHLERTGKSLTQLALDTALNNLNFRIRSRGLSAKEIIQRRKFFLRTELDVKDKHISCLQDNNRQ